MAVIPTLAQEDASPSREHVSLVMTASARGVIAPTRVGTEKRPSGRTKKLNKESEENAKLEVTCCKKALDRRAPYKGWHWADLAVEF